MNITRFNKIQYVAPTNCPWTDANSMNKVLTICGPHRTATYFCFDSVWELDLSRSLFRSLEVCLAVLPVPSPRRVAPNPAIDLTSFDNVTPTQGRSCVHLKDEESFVQQTKKLSARFASWDNNQRERQCSKANLVMNWERWKKISSQ